ncbi:MAG: hypothetical protein WA970_00735, partial [Gammaproteobacteria bacterium]
LERRVRALCTESDTKLTKQTPKDFRDFVNLQKSLVRNLGDLFTFVFADGVEPTNNRAEVRFVDPKPKRQALWGMGPEPKNGDVRWFENLVLV